MSNQHKFDGGLCPACNQPKKQLTAETVMNVISVDWGTYDNSLDWVWIDGQADLNEVADRLNVFYNQSRPPVTDKRLHEVANEVTEAAIKYHNAEGGYGRVIAILRALLTEAGVQ